MSQGDILAQRFYDMLVYCLSHLASDPKAGLTLSTLQYGQPQKMDFGQWLFRPPKREQRWTWLATLDELLSPLSRT
jgi:hypothetical protein